MKLLEDYIQTYGTILSSDVLKVDSFLNHQIDPALMMKLALDFQDHFKTVSITKIVTIETSGIAPSLMLAYLLQVPLVFFKKSASKITSSECYYTSVHSYTKDVDYTIQCAKKYLTKDDKVLFIDDFMANGEACFGAIDLLQQASASLEGIGIVIEKAFQPGRSKVEKLGYKVYAQARIASMQEHSIKFI
ncbi:MAG: xanthine phosphoribosyltransferase [Longicatena sp.]